MASKTIMNAKEKAYDLIDKFQEAEKESYLTRELAKKCSLIFVKEMIEWIEHVEPIKFQPPLLFYWNNVIEELEKQ